MHALAVYFPSNMKTIYAVIWNAIYFTAHQNGAIRYDILSATGPVIRASAGGYRIMKVAPGHIVGTFSRAG